MTTTSRELLASFDTLEPAEKQEVAAEILHRTMGHDGIDDSAFVELGAALSKAMTKRSSSPSAQASPDPLLRFDIAKFIHLNLIRHSSFVIRHFIPPVPSSRTGTITTTNGPFSAINIGAAAPAATPPTRPAPREIAADIEYILSPSCPQPDSGKHSAPCRHRPQHRAT